MAERPQLYPPAPPPLDEIARANPGWFDEAVNAKEAAKVTGVPPATLATWRSRGGGPKFLKLGRVVRYRRRALYEWMAARERRHTGDAGTQ
ncbi:helix-turn-helix transcriptional regulator [Hyphococcus sp.]|uniref:helix-turn-helix transcriptional regulator n=1 Tax=Hyphococcus sp. TaxID=2038636 RepID=UPI003D0ADC72